MGDTSGQFYRLAAILWALVAPLGVHFEAQETRASSERPHGKPPAERVIRFPMDRSIGTLCILDWDEVFSPYKVGSKKVKQLGEAHGNVTVPAGKQLILGFIGAQTGADQALDLSALDTLQPTDLQGLVVPFAIISPREANRLARHTALRYFSAPLSSLEDACLKPIGKLRSLQTLELERKSITDAGVKDLSGLTSLETLSLSGNNITDNGLFHLRNLKSLRVLEAHKTQITAGGAAELQKALPKLKVEW